MKNVLLCAITATAILGNQKALSLDRTVTSIYKGHNARVNTAPVSSYYYFTTLVNSTLSTSAEDGLLSKASDLENDALSIEVTKEPDHGTLLVEEDGSFTYTPEADYFGKDSFKYKVNDGQEYSEVSNVFLTVLTEGVEQLPYLEWEKTYGGSSIDDVRSLVYTNDGNILIGGSSESNDGDVPDDDLENTKFWTMKLDTDGNSIWSRSYLAADEDRTLLSVKEAHDQGLILGGNSRGTNHDTDILLIKVDHEGNTVWEKNYGGTASERFMDLILLENGDIVVVGSSFSSDGDLEGTDSELLRIWVLKIDLNGAIVWSQTYQEEELYAQFGTIVDNNQGGYYVGVTGGIDPQFRILNITENGDLKWDKQYGGYDESGAYISHALNDLVVLPNGNLLAAGTRTGMGSDILSSQKGGQDLWLVSINSQGDIVWEQTYGGSRDERFCKIEKTSDGGMIVAGYTSSHDGDVSSGFVNYDEHHLWIVKLDMRGNIVWSETYEITPVSNTDQYYPNSSKINVAITNDNELFFTDNYEFTSDARVIKFKINAVPAIQPQTGSAGENITIGETILNLEASDPDNDPLTFSIQSGNSTEAFELSTDGALTVSKELDFETTSVYNLTIEVSDGKHSSTAVLTVNIEDVNEAPTDIEVSTLEVSENLEANTLLGLLTSADQDGDDTHTYTLVEGEGAGDNASFTITGDQLLTAEVFDFETKSSFNIRLQTEDAEGETFSKAVTITVADVNEAPTNISLSSSSFAETSALNAVIGSLSTTDPDLEDSFSYSMSDSEEVPDNHLFLVDGDQLLANGSFNFEERSSFEIEVTSTDAGENVFSKTFTITLTDVNEPPVANSSTSETSEDTAVSGILTGSDPEQSDLSFSVAENPSHGSVSVDETTGAFTYTPSQNFNGSDSFTFVASDSELASEAATMTIAIASVNDAPTDVTMAPTSVTNTGGALQIGLALATTDVDADTFTYSKVAGEGDDDNALFDLEGSMLYTNSSAFLEKENSFSVRLATTDAVGASIEKQFVITIDYCNNTISASGGSSSSLTVPVFSGQEITLVTNDSNTGKNKVVWQKGAGYNIERYNIYKEGSNEDVYSLTGFVTPGESLEFVDNESDAAVKSFKYKITVVDQCGAESDLSDFHKTIHLTSSLGIDNDVNLIWNQYIGISYSSVELYKKEGEGEWTLLEALSSSTTSYTDKNYSNTVNTSYRVDVVLLQPVSLGRILETYSRISSNVLDIESTVLGTDSELDEIQIFPNPTSGLLQLKTMVFSSEVSIVDLAGSVLRRVTIGQNATIDIADLKPGVYLIRIDGVKTKTFRVIKR